AVISDEISVKIGEELELDVLLSNADKVETNSSGEWREVWSRTDRVQSDRLNENDENLIIKAFLASDAGTYRVLDTEGEILITVTATSAQRAPTEQIKICSICSLSQQLPFKKDICELNMRHCSSSLQYDSDYSFWCINKCLFI
uniref:Immunoglobulin subtype domain-containing protein n=1 Tax=Sinocyclocheilus grahami TaxID=75366 RepID=A0A672MAD4_SINGR